MDFRWTSMGGLLMDGNGDIAVTANATEELEAMVATRLKASSRSWKLYSIGANLNSFLGSPTGINRNTELAIQRSVVASLSDLLPAGSFNVQTLILGKAGHIETWFLPPPGPFADFRIRSRARRRKARNPHSISSVELLPASAQSSTTLPACATSPPAQGAQNLRICCALPNHGKPPPFAARRRKHFLLPGTEQFKTDWDRSATSGGLGRSTRLYDLSRRPAHFPSPPPLGRGRRCQTLIFCDQLLGIAVSGAGVPGRPSAQQEPPCQT